VPIELINVPFQRSGFSDHSSFRKEIQKHLRGTLRNKSVVNNDTGYLILFNNTGIDKMTSSIGDVKAIALCNLKLILTNAVLIEVQVDKKKRPDILSVLFYSLTVIITEKEYKIWLYIRQYQTGYYLYSLNIDNKKTP